MEIKDKTNFCNCISINNNPECFSIYIKGPTPLASVLYRAGA